MIPIRSSKDLSRSSKWTLPVFRILNGPEVALCRFLDERLPDQSPHQCYARHFTVHMLTELYMTFIQRHNVDAIVCMDGGSDSLMAGDESGLGDPIEDAVTVTTVARLPHLKEKILIAIGAECDRFNSVSDGATCRGMAELRARGGFSGSMAIEPTSSGLRFYGDCIDYMQRHASFRSVVSNSIVESARGSYGSETVTEPLRGRVQPDELFLWPPMSELFAFLPEAIVERRLFCNSIVDCYTVDQCYQILRQIRAKLEKERRLRPVERFP